MDSPKEIVTGEKANHPGPKQRLKRNTHSKHILRDREMNVAQMNTSNQITTSLKSTHLQSIQ